MKKTILKKCSMPLLILTMFISPFVFYTNVFAAPEVVVKSEAKDIPNDIVQQIVEENPNADVINILGYGDSSETNDGLPVEDISDDIPIKGIGDDIPSIGGDIPIKGIGDDIPSLTAAQALYTTPKTTKTITNKSKVIKDVFKFSVAKGESATLQQEYSASLTGSISGSYRKRADIGADITITGTFMRGTSYSGPPEESKYNSRTFRMKFFAQTGAYQQIYYKQLWLTGKLIKSEKIVKSGTYMKPTSWASYSVDSYEKNTTY